MVKVPSEKRGLITIHIKNCQGSILVDFYPCKIIMMKLLAYYFSIGKKSVSQWIDHVVSYTLHWLVYQFEYCVCFR